MRSVSVIIPVYNAGKFVSQCVESVIRQEEVSEIILVEDGSPDNSLEVCKKLVALSNKIRLYQHDEGKNRGAGESRNLGLKMASSQFVSFLDADDFFLPNRFRRTFEVFEQNSDADGVYEAIGYFRNGQPDTLLSIYSIGKILPPEKLFHNLLRGTYGHFHTVGLTIRKSLIEKSGYFNASLRLHQDSELWFRFAFHGRLYAGEISKPVTMVRKHEENRIAHANNKSRLEFWSAVMEYFKDKKMSALDYSLIIWKYCTARAKANDTSLMREVIYVLGSRPSLLKNYIS